MKEMTIEHAFVALMNSDPFELSNLVVGEVHFGWIVEHTENTKDDDYNKVNDTILAFGDTLLRCRVYGDDEYDDDFHVEYKLVNKIEKEVTVVKFKYE